MKNHTQRFREYHKEPKKKSHNIVFLARLDKPTSISEEYKFYYYQNIYSFKELSNMNFKYTQSLRALANIFSNTQ